MRIRRICCMCLFSLLAVGVAAGQESKTKAPVSENIHERTPPSASQTPESLPDLRRVQLRMLRESTLLRVVAGIKDMNEPALRISTRNQILLRLGSEQKAGEEDRVLMTQLASDALTDFSEHEEDIPPPMADYLFNDLGAWIQKHQPKLAERLREVEKNRKSGQESDRIRALLQTKGGDALAAQHIRQLLTEGQEVDGIFFYLDALRRGNSKEFVPLLSQIVEIAEHGPQVSFETLFWVSDIYLRPDVSVALKRRFLAMVISRTQPANFAVEPVPQRAYELLNQVLPFVRELDPESYDQAAAQSLNLRASFNERQLADEARNKRISESPDPFADLLSEAEDAPSKSERNELLAGAAQLALERKRFALCLEIVAKLDRDVAGSPPDFWRNWADQFLKGFVKAALADKDSEQAEKGAGRIVSPLAHVEGLTLLMRFHTKANDQNAVRRILDEAIKIAEDASDRLERAKAFLLLAVTSDEPAQARMLEGAVKALDSLAPPDKSASNKKLYQQYLRSLDNAGYQLIRGFEGLAKKDETSALALCENLRWRDMRTYALIGTLQGLDESLAATK
jgi:hypothetical protein